MTTFKSIAYQILKEADKPLHSKEITKRALERGLVTEGKTPEATMNALLVVDINTKKDGSLFVKTAPSTFAINKNIVLKAKSGKYNIKGFQVELKKADKVWKISKNISTKQKGDIAEARIAELVTLYGDTTLSCYKPISDDEGIDLIVKEKGSLKTMYIQIKSRFGSPEGIYTATVKAESLVDNYSVALVFCFFDTDKGDVWDYVWFVPAPDFLKLANRLLGGKMLGFVAGRKKKESNKWDNYLIDKRDLADAMLNQMKRI
jgi:hypothetical protein